MRPLRALALGLALLAPGLAHAQTTVLVRDEAGAPVSGAQVYRNCVYQGSTDAAGARRLTGVVAGDHLQVRKLVQTGPTAKGGHDGWSYHAWITNLSMENDGTQVDHTVLDPGVTQMVVVRRQNTQIGWNLVTSVEYNGTSTNLDDLALGLERASEYVFDVTDGQVFFEQATVYEDFQGWADADFQYSVTAWPSANVGGPAGMADARFHSYLPGPGFYGLWADPIAYRALGHEAGHYGLALLDEYHYEMDGSLNVECTAGRASDPETHRASIMAYPYDATELCHDGNHNPDSGHGRATGRSTWASAASTWSIGPWSLRTPMTRGAVNPGPDALSCFSRLVPRIVPAPTEVCEPLRLRARDARTDEPLVHAQVDLRHSGRTIYEGETSDAGEALIYGAAAGDRVSLRPWVRGNRCFCWGGSEDVTSSCGSIDVSMGCACVPFIFDRPFPQIRWHHEGDPPDIFIRIPAQDPGWPVQVSMEQDGLGIRTVQLSFDGKQQAFVGSFPFDPGRAARFALQLALPGPDGKRLETSARLQAARFQAQGAGELFPADGELSLQVDGAALPDGTAVLAWDTLFPQAPPEGLVARHGAVSLDAEAPLAKPVTLGLRYQGEAKSSVDPASIQIHRLEGETWVPIPTVVDADTQRATARIDRWGTYAVLAKGGF